MIENAANPSKSTNNVASDIVRVEYVTDAKPGRDQRQRQFIGENHATVINRGKGEEDPSEGTTDPQEPSREKPRRRHRHENGTDLHQRIKELDRGRTITTAATLKNPAQDWHKITCSKLMTALRTCGTPEKSR